MSAITGALKRLESTRWSTRKRGMEELVALGQRDLILVFALLERVPAVLDIAANYLYPEPPELLVHLLTSVKGPDAALASRFHLPCGNYLYAENEIVELYKPRGSRLALYTIEGLGLAYIKGMAPTLERFLNGEMINFQDAVTRFGKKAVEGVIVPSWIDDKRDLWATESAKVIAAAVALRQMNVEIESDVINRVIDQMTSAMPQPSRSKYASLGHMKWVAFDSDAGVTLDELVGLIPMGALSMLPDLANTLLRRGETNTLLSLIEEYGRVYFAADSFCYWPLWNFMESENIFEDVRNTRSALSYSRARKMGIAPPPWWTWR